MTKLAHENVAQIYTKLEEHGCTYLVMEIIGGGELFDTVRLPAPCPSVCMCALACVRARMREGERERERGPGRARAGTVSGALDCPPSFLVSPKVGRLPGRHSPRTPGDGD